MKKITTLIVIICISLTVFADNPEKEKEAIKKVIQTAYVEGLQNEGNLDKIDSGIHPGFNLLGIGQGNEMWNLPIEKWKESTVKRKEAGKMPKTDEEKVSIKFLSVDVTGTAAVAKIEFYIGKTLTYVDYISLYKFEDGWKMVNKIYYKFPEKK